MGLTVINLIAKPVTELITTVKKFCSPGPRVKRYSSCINSSAGKLNKWMRSRYYKEFYTCKWWLGVTGWARHGAKTFGKMTPSIMTLGISSSAKRHYA
jgi:hypothetical protein